MTIMVAEVGFEPTTSRLWASRAARLLYSAVCPFRGMFWRCLGAMTEKRVPLHPEQWRKTQDSHLYVTSISDKPKGSRLLPPVFHILAPLPQSE